MSKTIEVFPATTNDYNIIYSLAKIIWPHTYSKILSSRQLDYMFDMMYSPESYTTQIEDKGHKFLLAKTDNEYIGFASYEPDYTAKTTKIHKLYILPDVQRSGAGQELLKAIENNAVLMGNNKITLNVNRYNTARHFYEAKGFKKVAKEDIAIGNGYLMEDYIMEKEI